MKLKVGDKIYIKQYGEITGYEIVMKTTKTIARTKNYNFDIEINEDGYCHIRSKDQWVRPCGYIETEELNNEFKRIVKINWFNNKKFTKEEKIKIYNLIKEEL